MIPDFESLIVARLRLNNREIQTANPTKLKTPFTQLPSGAVDMGAFPFAAVRVGAMKNQIPNTSAGQLIVIRDYIIHLPVAPRDNTSDTGSQGADALTVTLPMFAIIRNYYLSHPRLETDGTISEQPTPLSALQYIHQDILFTDGGMLEMPTPGGVMYVGISYTLTIGMRGLVSRTA